jgi:hypothetical protein
VCVNLEIRTHGRIDSGPGDQSAVAPVERVVEDRPERALEDAGIVVGIRPTQLRAANRRR